MLLRMERLEGLSQVANVLSASEAASPVEAVEGVTRMLGQQLGATSVSFLIADMSGRALVRLAHVRLGSPEESAGPVDFAAGERRAGEESATAIPFDGGHEEEVVRAQQTLVLAPDPASAGSGPAHSWRVLAPVTERGELLGLLEMFVPEEPDGGTVEDISRLAHLLAFVVIANRRHTDLYQWGQRTRPMSLSAEIQHRLLPGPQTCEAGAFTLSGWLEPAADIAGDTFDFSLERDLLHLSMTDAMGHGVAAALSATLCVGSLRNSRNQGASLLEQARAANRALVDHAASSGIEDFVTGLVGRVDLQTGSLQLINAGHVAPYLCRGSAVTTLDLDVDLPFGLFPESTFRANRIDLQPGDRLVMVTDGMLEGNAAALSLPEGITDTRSLHPREAVRTMADRVLEATGHALRDDATLLCLDWHGDHGQDRHSVHGADLQRASDPVGE